MNKYGKYKDLDLKKKKSSNKWKVLAILVVLLLSATVGWAMWHREDPQVARLREMRDAIEELPREQRREKFREMRDEMEKLTPEQRDALWSDRRAEFQRREKERLKEFFAMTPEQQVAHLDKEIDRMKDRMKQWKDKAAQRGNRGGNGGGGGGGGGGQQAAQNFGRDASGNTGASDRTKNYLNSSDGDTRGASYEYRRMMNDRMRQRGT
jgi:hypothetical protein